MMTDLSSYIGNAEIFPILRFWDFYNHAGVSPLPTTATAALAGYARQIESAAYVNAGWWKKLEETRGLAASLLNCSKEEIAFVRNTSEGLSLVANAVDWRQGDVIVTTGVEYPTNMYPWMHAAGRFGAEVVAVKEETDGEGRRFVSLERILSAAENKRTRVLALSHVEFGSGQRHDLSAIGGFCRERGILFVVDAIQSVGAVPVDVAEMKIDYLSAGGQKWMLSPEGTGLFYCRKELLETTRPLTVGAMSVVNAKDFDHYNFTLRSDAGRFESGGYAMPGLVAMHESLTILAGLGAEAISERLKNLGDRLIDGVQAKGYSIASPRQRRQWSGIVSFSSPKHGHDELAVKLRAEDHVEIVVRHGRLRVAPHFYNTEGQIDRLIGLLPEH